MATSSPPATTASWDAERQLRDDSRRVISGLQLDYAQRYGVAALRIKHHAQLGYVIEAPSSAAEALRAQPDLTLRQSMANAARFTNPELADLDRRIAEAAERANRRETLLFDDLTARILAEATALRDAADALATLDVLQSCAQLAETGAWCRPIITEDAAFHRHRRPSPGRRTRAAPRRPVPTERLRSIPRPARPAAHRAEHGRQIHLPPAKRAPDHPGPAGLPIPATAARIGIADRLFSRVGAADDLARGRSTS